MFSRTLLKQSRVALRSSSASTPSLASRTQSNTQSFLSRQASASPLRRDVLGAQLAGRRWYSSEPEAKKEEGKEREAKEGDKELTGEEKLKKDIEKKDKEIIDLKVGSLLAKTVFPFSKLLIGLKS
jgi:molecular chaperone GrpE